jgi:hypothetical protein
VDSQCRLAAERTITSHHQSTVEAPPLSLGVTTPVAAAVAPQTTATAATVAAAAAKAVVELPARSSADTSAPGSDDLSSDVAGDAPPTASSVPQLLQLRLHAGYMYDELYHSVLQTHAAAYSVAATLHTLLQWLYSYEQQQRTVELHVAAYMIAELERCKAVHDRCARASGRVTSDREVLSVWSTTLIQDSLNANAKLQQVPTNTVLQLQRNSVHVQQSTGTIMYFGKYARVITCWKFAFTKV